MSPLTFTFDKTPNWTTLENEWRQLEQSTPHSFFQSWSWLGPLAEERFDSPLILKGEGQLAICNRHRGRLLLSESGRKSPDALFIEYNAPLCAPHLTEACVTALRGATKGPLRLSGITEQTLAAVGRHRLRSTRPAPWINLAALTEPTQDAWLATLSANTRAQIRRSNRAYEAAGPITATRAPDPPTALAWLDRLAELHQQTWTARGKPGAFADPFFARFHRALITAAFDRDEIDLLKITAGTREIGYLYHFHHRGRVYSYQSGFAYGADTATEKPGLTSHHAAIALSLARGDTAYDFLAGHERYKTSLARNVTDLFWVEAGSALALAAGRVIEKLS